MLGDHNRNQKTTSDYAAHNQLKTKILACQKTLYADFEENVYDILKLLGDPHGAGIYKVTNLSLPTNSHRIVIRGFEFHQHFLAWNIRGLSSSGLLLYWESLRDWRELMEMQTNKITFEIAMRRFQRSNPTPLSLHSSNIATIFILAILFCAVTCLAFMAETKLVIANIFRIIISTTTRKYICYPSRMHVN